MNILEVPKTALELGITMLTDLRVSLNVSGHIDCNEKFRHDCNRKKLKFNISFYIDNYLEIAFDKLENIAKVIELNKCDFREIFSSFQARIYNPLISNSNRRWIIGSDLIYNIDFNILNPSIKIII